MRPQLSCVCLGAIGVTALLALCSAPVASATAPSHPGSTTLGRARSAAVSPDTVAPLRSIAVSTSAQLAQALKAAVAGDTIVLAAGTYSGPFSITSSGTAAHPIVVQPAVGAAVTLTAALPRRSCAAGGPDEDRTVEFHHGASYWTLRGLAISGGVLISGDHADTSNSWLAKLVAAHDWSARRQLPGSSSYDASTVAAQVSYVAAQTQRSLPTSDSIKLVSDVVTGKGIFTRLARFGVIRNTVVKDVACGSGPGIWLANFSSGWTVAGNDVSAVAHSDASHYMQEGIRMSSASNYNTVTGNSVHDLPDQGRGITTDVDASFNTISHNTVRAVAIGFSDEQSGWGNIWDHNLVVGARQSGYSFRMEDIGLVAPSRDTSTWSDVVSCNTATATPVGIEMGSMGASTFTSNAVGSVYVGRAMRDYWASTGNTWNGSTSLPPALSSPSTGSGC
ncbi:MAG: right-handed parallel beta-helix repeat-containing protein [Actinomycetota bacterium]|nr:right-handed parallel beta-helix repeat-containing protein [Actinomycetota bacterium]